MSILSTLAAAAAGLSLLAPAAPATTVDLSGPGSLARGDDVRLPHREGTDLVDGDVRVDLGTDRFDVMGASGDDYVVHRWTQRSGRDRILRVTAGGDRTVLLRGKDAWGATLSSDGSHVLTNDNARRAGLAAYDATDGGLVSSTRFRGYGYVLDAAGGTALLSSWERQRVVAWDFVEGGGKRLVSPALGYHADLAADRLATYTKDPYLDGCTEVVAISAPDDVLWRSCRQKVAEFSSDGRMVTMHTLTDGAGPGAVQQRAADGTKLVTYTSSWFGQLRWEDADTLLLDANSRHFRGAVVRCDLDACERASDLYESYP